MNTLPNLSTGIPTICNVPSTTTTTAITRGIMMEFNGASIESPKWTHAAAIVSPLTQGKPTVSAAELSSLQVPLPPSSAAPTLYVHIMFNGVTSSQNHASGGAGALVSIVSVPQSSQSDQQHGNGDYEEDLHLPHNQSTFRAYRIRQYYTVSNRSIHFDDENSPVNRHFKYYVAFIAALRVTLNHVRNIQPSLSHVNTASGTTQLQPPPPYYQIHKIQIEGCHRTIMDTIYFLSRYPISTEKYLDPLLQEQFDVIHVLLRQLSDYYITMDATSGYCEFVLGVVRVEPRCNSIADALAKEAIDLQKSWMTTSDDYHMKAYALPTTVVESLYKNRKRL